MTPEQILAIAPKVLTQAQRESYFSDGYSCSRRRHRRRVAGAAARRHRRDGRAQPRSDEAPTRSSTSSPTTRADSPRLRRVTSPVDQHPVYWAYVTDSMLADVVADLVGPDVKFHHSKLNFKWAQGRRGGQVALRHPFWPHTNYSPLTVGTYLYDCGMDQGPLGVLPRSHRIEPLLASTTTTAPGRGPVGPRRRRARPAGARVPDRPGRLGDHPQLPHAHRSRPTTPTRPAAAAHTSTRRPTPCRTPPIRCRATTRRSSAASAPRFAHHDPRPCLIPPDWSRGYTSIFALQQEEESRGAMM